MAPTTVTKPVALWTVPRSASTAFERMMMERGDLTIFHEPFSLHYYYGPRKRSGRYDEVRADADPETILAEVTTAVSARPVFLKDMAYHVADVLDADFAARFTNTFLVRDPAWTLPSLAAMWPDFTDEEAGYGALERFVDLVDDPIVVDSDDLLRDPEPVVRAYCGAVGLAHRPDALRWEPGMPPEWTVWADWHDEVTRSTGFQPPPDEAPPPITDARLAATHARCREIYERLRAKRLHPDP